jgi:hypothetical protein
MATHITATVIGGLLKPDQALPLAEQTRVRLTIEPLAAPQDAARAWAEIKARLRERPIHSRGKRFTRDQLHERG